MYLKIDIMILFCLINKNKKPLHINMIQELYIYLNIHILIHNLRIILMKLLIFMQILFHTQDIFQILKNQLF